MVVGSVNITTFAGIPGTFSIWSVDFSGSNTPTISEVAAVPQAKILNGLTHLKSNSAIVLAADSEQGIVYSVDVTTKVVAVAIQNTAFGPGSRTLGINGLHVDASGENLYFTNSALGTYGVVPINGVTGSATGAVKTIATDPAGNYDDFALDGSDDAFITNHPNSILEVAASGQETTIYNSTSLLQPTSAIFSSNGQTLYVVADGDAEFHTQSGQVWAFTN